MTCEVINLIRGIKDKSYLELGAGRLSNFNKINAGSKTSVDINGRADFTGTTDDFFATTQSFKKWDLIFIDANHDYIFALKDFNNSVLHCNEWIIMHDMIPPTASHTAPRLCSDSFKLLYYLISETDLDVYPMDGNMGMTFIKMPAVPIDPPYKFMDLTYPDFCKKILLFHLYSGNEIVKILNGGQI